MKNHDPIISGHAQVSRVLHDKRFESILTFGPAENAESPSCPWLKFRSFFSNKTSTVRSPHEVRDILKTSFLFCEGQEHERIQRPIKKKFIESLQPLPPFLELSTSNYLNLAREKHCCEWFSEIIKPYIQQSLLKLCGLPEGLGPKLDEWFEPQLIQTLLCKNSSHTAKQYNTFLEALAYIEDFMSSPDSKNTTGFFQKIGLLAAEPTSFSRNEISGNLLVFLLASIFSPPPVLAKCIRTLLERPDLLRQLQENPGLLPAATLELLRFHLPVKNVQRQLSEDVLFEGNLLRAGSVVNIDLISANRDPAVFESPDEISFTRSSNPHLSFGAGLHYCLGAPLARMQIESFLRLFVRETLHVRYQVEKSEGSPQELWIRCTPHE